MRYHVNPATGKTGVCKASVGTCPFGGDAAHYSREEDARTAFELSMAGQAIVRHRRDEEQRKRDEAAAANPNLDRRRFDDVDSMWEALSPEEQDKVWSQDTVVREWYYDARFAGLAHEAAYAYAQDWDARSYELLKDDASDAPDYETERLALLTDYLRGRITATEASE